MTRGWGGGGRYQTTRTCYEKVNLLTRRRERLKCGVEKIEDYFVRAALRTGERAGPDGRYNGETEEPCGQKKQFIDKDSAQGKEANSYGNKVKGIARSLSSTGNKRNISGENLESQIIRQEKKIKTTKRMMKRAKKGV